MKHYTILLSLLSIMTLAACKDSKYDSKLTYVDSLIANNLDSLASVTIDSIHPANIKESEARAYYNMLKVELTFRSGEVLPNDSMINISIAKFQENGDNHKLAQSLYFKGRIQFKRGETKSAIKNLLEAKEAAKETGDGTLKAKTYGNLAFLT